VSHATESAEDLLLTRRGLEALTAEHRRLSDVKRPEAVTALREAIEVAGDLADNPEYLQAREDLDRVEARIAVLEARLRAARQLRAHKGDNGPTTCSSRHPSPTPNTAGFPTSHPSAARSAVIGRATSSTRTLPTASDICELQR
jgi:hypothetical protein